MEEEIVSYASSSAAVLLVVLADLPMTFASPLSTSVISLRFFKSPFEWVESRWEKQVEEGVVVGSSLVLCSPFTMVHDGGERRRTMRFFTNATFPVHLRGSLSGGEEEEEAICKEGALDTSGGWS